MLRLGCFTLMDYTSENGRNWTKLNNGSNGFPSVSISEFDRLEISVTNADPSVVYVAGRSTAGGSNDVGIFLRSSDRGLSWESMTVPRDPNGTHFTRGQAWYDLILASDPQDADILYAGGIDLYRSVDGDNHGCNYPIGTVDLAIKRFTLISMQL